MKTLEVHPCANLAGSVKIPGDKSISHRALMLASLASGKSVIDNLLEGHDCMATLSVMRALGVHIALEDGSWKIDGRGKFGFLEPSSILDCKNSGTTIRLMAGLLAGMPFMSVLDGTDQIKTRPMDRVIIPLTAMNARVFGRNDNRLAPLVVLPSKLLGKEHILSVKSAQVKSALALAGLFAEGKTVIRNIGATRDHTERLLSFMGAKLESKNDVLTINPLAGELRPISLKVPGDISSAAFLMVAGAVCSPQGITLRDVGINQTRTGIIDAMIMMGASINISNQREIANEPIADLVVKKSKLKANVFAKDHVVRMIDEIPILALLATQAEGTTVIKDATELKVKETNRIAKTVELLKALGGFAEETDDGMIIKGPTTLKGIRASSFLDHRLALLLGIAGLMTKTPVTITSAHVTDDSFPGFADTLRALGATVTKED
jgi:3-phosphoshikimate 1-carboxyvinyltransferase